MATPHFDHTHLFSNDPYSGKPWNLVNCRFRYGQIDWGFCNLVTQILMWEERTELCLVLVSYLVWPRPDKIYTGNIEKIAVLVWLDWFRLLKPCYSNINVRMSFGLISLLPIWPLTTPIITNFKIFGQKTDKYRFLEFSL